MIDWQPIESAPDEDEAMLLFRDYGGYYDVWIGLRSTQGNYWIAQPDARIIEPTHWCAIPRLPTCKPALQVDKDFLTTATQKAPTD